jgi:endoglucanase
MAETKVLAPVSLIIKVSLLLIILGCSCCSIGKGQMAKNSRDINRISGAVSKVDSNNRELSSVKMMPNDKKLALPLFRGITLDRQYHSVPRSPNFKSADIKLIKSMGFDFVKLIVNPAPHKDGDKIVNMHYIDAIVNRVLSEGIKIVVCIHPENNFKNTVFGSKSEFRSLCLWYESFARYLAVRWSRTELVFQLMTEPFGDSPDPNEWNCWNKLQPEMWQAVRRGMPEHTLILSGDKIGRIEGLITVEPVKDDNVMYAFSHYEPFIFTLQGGIWVEFGDFMPFTQHIPYPSNPEIVAAALPDILRKVPLDFQNQATDALKAYGAQCWDKNKLTERIQMLTAWSKSHGGVKLFCGEFGCLQKTVEPQHRYAFISDFRQVFEENGVSWSYWSFKETFTVLNKGKLDEKMLTALFGQSR